MKKIKFVIVALSVATSLGIGAQISNAESESAVNSSVGKAPRATYWTTAYIKGSNVIKRSGPGTSYTNLGQFSNGAKVTAEAWSNGDILSVNSWVRLKTPGINGGYTYVSSKYVSKSK
ncbi:SH3 domain-containing protein [uncultured Enterococcus sp.]|uniref:SH3 domain-containing protein n=1 Tax=uncultured Enterococcus sp. TaxID=167972 RepID=UPI002AA8B15E|nr:SH3 domain-containing protein [uncultured Enterococcus sp.]